jgi:outer membrane immunogenic protein
MWLAGNSQVCLSCRIVKQGIDSLLLDGSVFKAAYAWNGNGMKRVIWAGVTLLLTGASAGAADLPVKAFYKAPPVPVWTWDGLYAGINAGYSFGQDTFTEVPLGGGSGQALGGRVLPNGAVAGGQLGYNWQLGHIVLGVEGDAQWSGQRDTGCGGFECTLNFNGEVGAFMLRHQLDWFATARGRAGVTSGGYLIYVTTGAAWAGVRETNQIQIDQAVDQATVRRTLDGWALGGGIEGHLAGNWTVKLEYLHLDFGPTTTTSHLSGSVGGAGFDTTQTVNSRWADNIVRVGLNYRLWNAPTSNAIPVNQPAAAWNWTGFYLGINGGYGMASSSFRQYETLSPAFLPPGNNIVSSFADQKLGANGGFAGGQVGYNLQFDRVVVGLEADAQSTNQNDTGCGESCVPGAPNSVTQSLNWFGTLRARLGWAGQDYLLYATAGGALGEIQETDTATGGFGENNIANFKQTRGGWVAGGGIEARLFGNWTGKVEYLHLDLGSMTTSFPLADPFSLSLATKSSYKDDIFRVGLNYRFGTAGPIAANF